MTKQCWLIILSLLFQVKIAYSWGFFGHARINHYAVYLLPPEMLVLFKPSQLFLETHAADPDKRRYMVEEEGPRHYIDLDHYGQFPFDSLPRGWKQACEKFSEDSLKAHGIVPWHIQVMMARLTRSFSEHDYAGILKNSAELGHYVSDAHVPLHACSNHNGQKTGQRGIHGFWESRIPELLAAKEFNFFIGKAAYLKNPGDFIWQKVLESASAADTVLRLEKKLSEQMEGKSKYAFEDRNGKVVKQYSSDYTIAYNRLLNGMVERRMRESIWAVASCWFTAWVNAGQPDLKQLQQRVFSPEDQHQFMWLQQAWQKGNVMLGRSED